MEVEDFLASRWVRVFCDIGCEGIWDREGVPMELDDLPLSDALKARVMAWQDWYEQDDAFADPPVTIDWQAFSEEGRQIAHAIKQALPDWTVIYFDEYRCRSRGPQAPRTSFEYEIHLTETESPAA